LAPYYNKENIPLQIAELLLINGSKSIRIKDDSGNTPIFFSNMYAVVELIVRFDSSVLDSVDKYGDGFLASHVKCLDKIHTKTPGLISAISLFGGVAEYRRLCCEQATQLVPVEITEDELAEVRYRTYFSCSLVYYLLCVGRG
jgi:hypothetical protein